MVIILYRLFEFWRCLKRALWLEHLSLHRFGGTSIKNYGSIVRTLFLDLISKHNIYIYFELVITTKCTLNCKYCANLMPYYGTNSYECKLEDLYKAIDNLMSLVDRVVCFRIIGGEPLMSPNFSSILTKLMEYKQSGKILFISAPTNGVIAIPDEHTIQIMHKSRMWLDISDYGYGNIKQLCKYLDNSNVLYTCNNEKKWFDNGDIKNRNRTHQELDKQFKACPFNTCYSILNGKIYYCPRSGHGNDIGLISVSEKDYFDLFSNNANREKLQFFYNRKNIKHITACNYCDAGTKDSNNNIPAGKEQIKR